MTRVEDALRKLQAAAALPRGATSSAQQTPRAQVGTPAERVERSDPLYGGKRIEVSRPALKAQALLAPDAEEPRLAEEYRLIKRPLIRNADIQHEPQVPRGNLLIVTSALSGEGKTFTCLNLCLSMTTEKDWSVLLVDADCSKPHLSRIFGAENEPGLLDVLRDPNLTFESAVMPTDIPGLSFLPAGARDIHASELLASQRMSTLCSQLSAAQPNRILVFDSSPALLTTEAPMLAAHVGQILMVVHANKTPVAAVTAALEKFDRSKSINLVLNQLEDRHALLGEYGYGTYGS